MSPLDPLAPDQRAVVALVLQQGRSYDDIAALLGIPVGAVRARAHAGLAALAPDNGLPIEITGPIADFLLAQQPAVPHDTLMARWLSKYQLSPVVTAALERLLERCRQEKIEVLLIGAFEMEGHRALYTPEIDSIYLGYIRALTAKYGCRFQDHRNVIPDHGYKDPLHVNKLGAEYYSRLVTRECLIPLWREMNP